MASVSLEVKALPVVSYVMAHNAIAVVSSIVITCGDDVPAEAILEVQVGDSHGPLSSLWSQHVALRPNDTVRVDPVEIRLDPQRMARVEETRPGRLEVALLARSEVIEEHVEPLRVLAAHHWMSQPELLATEMLAAHVMPNAPELGALLAEVSTQLEADTGSGSIEGYQGGAARVDDIAGAIWRVTQRRGVAYSVPPASWTDVGQKVRTPHEVLETRLGTCLDLCVTMAAALEQAGLRPLIFLTSAHAFLGYWRKEATLGSAAQIGLSDLANQIDLDNIRLIETTLVTRRETDVTFEVSNSAPYAGHVAKGASDPVHAVLDVFSARRSRILPLPATTVVDGVPQVIYYQASEHSRAPVDRPSTGTEPARRSSDGRQRAPARVRQWKNTLLDLSLRNRLINLTDRAALTLYGSEALWATVEDRLNAGRIITLLPNDDFDEIHRERLGIQSASGLPPAFWTEIFERRTALYADISSNAYVGGLRTLANKAKTIAEETGANNLYLALGTLAWKVDAKQLRSPLVLVPVTLRSGARKNSPYQIALDESGASTPNYCLLEKLKQEHDLSIPGLENPVMDDSGIDLGAAFRAVRVAIAEKGLPYRVDPTAHLGILQFAKFRLWKDLDENWQQIVETPVVRHLAYTPNEPFSDPAPEPATPDMEQLSLNSPITADGSQLEAIHAAVHGRTFVLEGPPGTGKSQTITNLLARAMANGRRVLFVAEKRAALDVVKRRIDAVGLGDFTLDLHDKNSRPTIVRGQILRALDAMPRADQQALRAATDTAYSAARSLTRYRDRLHEPNAAGLTLYSSETERLVRANGVSPLPIPPHSTASLSPDDFEVIRSLLRTLPETADPARPTAFAPWSFATRGSLSDESYAGVSLAAQKVDRAVMRRPRSGPVAEALLEAHTTQDLRDLLAVVDAPRLPLDQIDRAATLSWRADADRVAKEVAAFVAAAHPGLDQATPEALDLPLADIHARAMAAQQSSWWGRKKRLLAVGEELKPGLQDAILLQPKEVTALSSALLQLQGAVRGLNEGASRLSGVKVPANWNPLTAEGKGLLDRQLAWAGWLGQRLGVQSDDDLFRNRLRTIATTAPTDPAVREVIQDLASGFAVLESELANPESLADWASDAGLVQRWEGTGPTRHVDDPQLTTLRNWLAFRAHLAPLAERGLSETHGALLRGAIHADDASQAFELGVAIASQAERLQSTSLDGFAVGDHEKAIKRFDEAADTSRALLPEHLGVQVVQHRSFSSTAPSGMVGALRRELGKQRRGLPIRSLMDQYGTLITEAMPCVLVSPDSLARFFPVKPDLFDIVVFDEASQIRVADAVGALGRARSAVVVGDSKQMPPTTFAETSIAVGPDEAVEGDGYETVVEDEESILDECVQARFDRKWLSVHYRSQDESLIAFSNARYYEGRLASFPAPTFGHASPSIDGHGVNFVRVNGTFLRSGKGRLLRTNQVEADSIVLEVVRRFATCPHGQLPSIGIVTFNQQQRALIESQLRDLDDERIIAALDSTAEEGLFVKNLENVQGDERDTILFSVAFSKNDKGALPLNFGPLNLGGGERRLNVAITRARRQVVIYCSFDPGDLRAEQSSSVGVKHLRAYLEAAASGDGTLAEITGRRPLQDRHAVDVAQRLRERGLIASTDVGLSEFRLDLALAKPSAPEEPVVAVLFDGPGWASRQTVNDRDGVPQSLLVQKLRWPAVERVWLPDWLTAPDVVLDRLEHATLNASSAVSPIDTFDVADPHESPAELPSQDMTVQEQLPIVRAASDQVNSDVPITPTTSLPTLPGQSMFSPYVPRHRGPREHLDDLAHGRRSAAVDASISDVLRAEAPIHEERLARLVAAEFDLARVNTNRIADITEATDRRPVNGFFWTTRDTTHWTVFRTDPEAVRPLEHIALREISNAMMAICQSVRGAERDELFADTLGVFGMKRRTPKVTERLQQALDLALSDKVLTYDEQYLVPNPRP